MKKYSRSGLIKNWQSRYFVLNQGKIAYYQNQSDRFPYGDEFKGELGLFQATVSTDSKKVGSDKQFYIVGANGEKDLLVELELASDVDGWVRAVCEHIDYANRRGSIIDTTNDNRGSDSPVDFRGSRSLAISTSQPSSAAEFPVTPAPGFVIKVLRTNGEKVFVNLCEAGEVPMMNLTIGYSKWPFMILTPSRTIQEEKESAGSAAEISVYDAIVNPAVLVTCGKNPEAKDATCARVLRLLKKQYGEDLQEEYKLPKIAKRYKGEIQTVLVPVDIQQLSKTRSSIHVRTCRKNSVSGTNDVQQTAKLTRQLSAPLPSRTTSEEKSFVSESKPSPSVRQQVSRQNTEPVSSNEGRQPMSRVKSVNMQNNYSGSSFLRRKSDNESSFVKEEAVAVGAGRPSSVSMLFPPVRDGSPMRRDSAVGSGVNEYANLPINPNRLVIPYIIIRSNGASARTRPEKLSQSKNLGHNTRVFVNARRFLLPDKVVWLRTTDGWITERVYVGSQHRVLQPCMHGQPLRAKVVTTRFEDVGGSNLRSSYGGRNTTVSQSGWFGFRDSAIYESFQTRFSIDIFFPDNAVIRISRTLAEFLTMRQQLLSFPDKMIQDRALKAGEIYCSADGDENLVLDVHYLLEVVEGVETWLCKLLSTLHVEKCKCRALVDFLNPKESDMDTMEGMLSCKAGLNGAWPEVEIELEYLENSIQE
jgi:hypothetical protein